MMSLPVNVFRHVTSSGCVKAEIFEVTAIERDSSVLFVLITVATKIECVVEEPRPMCIENII